MEGEGETDDSDDDKKDMASTTTPTAGNGPPLHDRQGQGQGHCDINKMKNFRHTLQQTGFWCRAQTFMYPRSARRQWASTQGHTSRWVNVSAALTKATVRQP